MMYTAGTLEVGDHVVNNGEYGVVGDFWSGHGSQAVHKPVFPDKVCFDWSAGNCSRYNCKFAHPEQEDVASKATAFKKASEGKNKRQPKIATLREIRSFAKKVLKMKFEAFPEKLPGNIFRGLMHYNIGPRNAQGDLKLYKLKPKKWGNENEVRFMYANLLEELSERLKPLVSGRLQTGVNSGGNGLMRDGIMHDDMSVTSASNSVYTNTTAASAPSVIQEALFDMRCKGSKVTPKSTWSECSDATSMSGSDISTSTTMEMLVVIHYPSVNVYSGPDLKSAKVAAVKYGQPVTVFQRQQGQIGMWIRTSKGWTIERIYEGAGAKTFLMRPKPQDLVRVTLPVGFKCISSRRKPVAPSKLSMNPNSADIVGKLSNGDVVVVMERMSMEEPDAAKSGGKKSNAAKSGGKKSNAAKSGGKKSNAAKSGGKKSSFTPRSDWIRHAGGWTLEHRNGVQFFERVENKRISRTGGQGNQAVCFNWLRNNGVCKQRGCQYMHAYPEKQTDRDGSVKICYKHKTGTCPYKLFPRGCKFSHGKARRSAMMSKSSGWTLVPSTAVAAPSFKATSNVTMMDLKKALAAKKQSASERVAESKKLRKMKYKLAKF